MGLKSSAPDSVVDANVFIAICAKESKTYPVALAEMRLRVQAGCAIYAPGVLIVETLYILCRKLETGVMGPAQHRRAIQRLRHGVRGILPPPQGDASLAIRAEEIRSGYGCSRSADGLYIALAEQLAQTGPAELVTFDAGMASQAAAVAPRVVVRLLGAP